MKAATIARLKAAAHAVKGGAAGAKGSLIATGTGAATGIVLGKLSDKLPQFLKDNWWAIPAGMAVAGHFVKRKNANIGTALCGAAGMYGAISYMMANPSQFNSGAKGLEDAQPGAGAMYGSNSYATGSYRDFAPAPSYGQFASGLGDAQPDAGMMVSDAHGLST